MIFSCLLSGSVLAVVVPCAATTFFNFIPSFPPPSSLARSLPRPSHVHPREYPQWIREGHAFLILYSVDEASTFDNAYAMRKKIERAKDVESFPMVLVGNKCDKPSRQITTEQGTQKALEMGCPYIETSAKSGVRTETPIGGALTSGAQRETLP